MVGKGLKMVRKEEPRDEREKECADAVGVVALECPC